MLGDRIMTEDEIAQIITTDKVEKSLHNLFHSDDYSNEPASNYNTVAPERSTIIGNRANPESPRSIIKAMKQFNPSLQFPIPEHQLVHLLKLSEARNSKGEYLVHKYNIAFIVRLLDKKSFLKLERTFKKLQRLDGVITLTDFVWSFISAIWNKLRAVSYNTSDNKDDRDLFPELYVTNSLIEMCSRLLNVRKTIRWRDVTNFMIQQINENASSMANKMSLIDAAMEVKNLARQGYQDMLRRLDLDLPTIYGTVQHRRKRVEKNNRGRDTRKHLHGIKK